MEIIVEYVLIDNLVINFLILYLSALILRTKKNNLRIFCAACFGAIFSLITPLLTLPLWLEIVYKLILGLVVCRIGIKSVGLKKSALCFGVFLLTTAAFAGACFGIVFLFGGEINSNTITVFGAEIPVGVVLLVCALVAFAIAKIHKKIEKRKLLGKFVFFAEIKNKGKQASFDVFLDSGNTLVDPVSNKPVLIAEFCVFSKLFEIPIDKLITRKISESDFENAHYISYGAVGGGGKMLVVEVEDLTISFENKKSFFKNVALGLSYTKFEKCFDCVALMGTQFAREFV